MILSLHGCFPVIYTIILYILQGSSVYPDAIPVVVSSYPYCCDNILHISLSPDDVELPILPLSTHVDIVKYISGIIRAAESSSVGGMVESVSQLCRSFDANKMIDIISERSSIYAVLQALNEFLHSVYYFFGYVDHQNLFSEPVDIFLNRFIPTLTPTISFTGEQFYQKIRDMSEQGNLHVYSMDKHNRDNCVSEEMFRMQPCLLYTKDSWALNEPAVSAIAQTLNPPCSKNRLLHFLSRWRILSGRRVNSDSYQSRLRVYFQSGNNETWDLYEINRISGILAEDEKDYRWDAVRDRLYFQLGKNAASEHEMYWDFDNEHNLNQHMLITGQSGAGKSCFLRDLLRQTQEQKITTVVFHHQGEVVSGENVEIIDIFEKHPGLCCFKEVSPDHREVAEHLAAALQLTELQQDIVADSYKTFVHEWDLTSVENSREKEEDALFSEDKPSVNKFIGEILNGKDTLPEITPSIRRKFKNLEALNGAAHGHLDWAKYAGKTLVLDFRKNNGDVRLYKCYTELYLHDLYSYQIKTGYSSQLIIVSDEFQNMNTKKKSMLDKILREGRKYKISLWLASQLVENDSSSRLKYITDQSAMKIYFQAGTERSRKIANLLGRSSSERSQLFEKMRELSQREFVFQLNGAAPHKCIANEVKDGETPKQVSEVMVFNV